MKQYPSPPPAACVPAALLLAWRRLRRILFHDKAGDIVFRAALAPFALAAALLAIPADEARAHNNSNSATLHAENYPLHRAVESRDIDELRHLLTYHAYLDSGYPRPRVTLNALDDQGRTALHIAATITMGMFAVSVVDAFARGEDGDNNPLSDLGEQFYTLWNAPDGQGRTPLRAAADNENWAMVARLFEYGGGYPHWGEECAYPLVANPTYGREPAGGQCVCADDPRYTKTNLGECEAVARCAAPAVLNAGTNRCDCPAPNVGADGADAPGDCVAASAESCGGLTPAKFYSATLSACVAVAECAAPAVLNAGANLCDCPAPNVGADGADAPGDCVAASVESCGRLTPPAFYDAGAGACAPFADCQTGATLNRVANQCECAGAAVLDGAGTGCLCESPNVGTPGDCAVPSAEVCGGLTPAKFYSATVGACVAVARCALPSVLNAGANLCDCPAPNVGTDGADAPGDCVAASAESCGGLTPAKFYDAGAGACVAVARCALPSVLNAGANLCDCPAPNVGTDGADAPGDCVAASAESCGGLTPAKFYDAGAGACVAVARCALPSVLNAGANLCDCPAPNVGTDGADAPGDCVAASAESCGGLTPAKFYDAGAGACVAVARCAAPAVLNARANRCDCPAPNVGTDGADAPGDCVVASAESCGGLTPAKFYDAGAGACVAVARCAAPAVLNARANLCDCPAPNVGTDGADAPGDCVAASAESCGGLTPAKFYDSAAGECVAVAACAAPAVLNAGANRCDCPAPNVGADGADAPGDCVAASVESCGGLTPAKFYDSAAGECVAVAACAAPAVLNAGANRCDCPAPNVGADGADAPGDCVAASAESCGGLTPAKFYDSAAGECVPLAYCLYEEERNAETNICECLAPNVRSDYGCRAPSAYYCGRTSPPQFYSPTLSACAPYDECLAAGDCALSATACARGFSPDKFYDSATGECVAVAECHDTAELNPDTNECECTTLDITRRHLRTSGVCESSCNAAERRSVAQGKSKYRNAACSGCLFSHYKCECPAATAMEVNGVCEFLYPCHDSAIRKADNSGCECPTGTFAHGDPSGGGRYNGRVYARDREGRIEGYTYYNRNKYGQYEYIPDTAECHAEHAPLAHDLTWTNAITLDDPEVISHFVAGHGRDPDANHDLHYAVERGYHQAAKALIASGADIDRKNGAGDAPLHPAVRNERAELITLLLQRGANADAKDDDGDTALHLAARRPDTAENAGLIAFLLDKGADPNIFNVRRWRPLDLADGRDGYPRRRKIMAALIAGGANWSDECVGGKTPNEYTPPKCKCPPHLSIDNNGLCECPAHSHSQVNGRCLPKDSAQVEAEILKMETELLRLRAALVSLNARLSAAAEMPREAVEEIAEQAGDTAQEIKRRRDNFLALARADLAGAPPPPVAMSDTAAECRMLGGEVQIHSATGIRICSGIDANDTFCLVDSGDAYPCRGLFRHVRTCNDDYNRRALNPFFCGARCGAQKAVGKDCAAP